MTILREVTRGFRVVGKVQGVSFRHSTRIEAEKLKVRGVARNLADGSVEIWARGEETAVLQLREWLKLGPALARVDAVEDVEPAAHNVAHMPACFEVR